MYKPLAIAQRSTANLIPNTLLIGAGKAGTTSLFAYLSLHPDVCAARVKEVGFFDPVVHGQPTPDLKAYRSAFKHWRGERILLEGTPRYLAGGRSVALAIREALGNDVAILVLLRDPIARLRSYYRYKVSRMQLPGHTEFSTYVAECLRREDLNLRAPVGDPMCGLWTGRYGETLPAWYEVFGSQLWIGWFDDLVRRPASVLASACQSLGLSSTSSDLLLPGVANQTRGFRRPRLQRTALAVNSTAEHLFRRFPRVKSKIRNLYYRVNEAPIEASLTPDLTTALSRYYADSNQTVRRIAHDVGALPLPEWLT